MSSLWTNLLFMHGHIADPELARRLADAPKPPARPTGKRRKAQPASNERKVAAPAGLAQGGCA